MTEWMESWKDRLTMCPGDYYSLSFLLKNSHQVPPHPYTLALSAAYQPVPLGTETSVGAIGVDAVTPNAGCREVTLINICRG